MRFFTTTALLSATLAAGFNLPDNLSQIYNKFQSGKCSKELGGGFDDGSNGSGFAYCGDVDGAILLRSNMDVDCDGANNSGGKCGNDPSGQGQTAFKDEASKFGISDLDANVHPYVVFGNSDSNPTFDPQQFGMEPLSVMAVVCNKQVIYGVWGDTNGGTSTGEASISLAELCFPKDGITGDSGHDQDDVLYIGFTGKTAVPGDSADWKAGDAVTFEKSIKDLGDKLVAGLSA